MNGGRAQIAIGQPPKLGKTCLRAVLLGASLCFSSSGGLGRLQALAARHGGKELLSSLSKRGAHTLWCIAKTLIMQ